MPRPALFVTVGTPGAGKSYIADQLAKEFKLFHLRSAEIRRLMFPAPNYSAEENKRLFKLMDSFAEELLSRGVGVIYDANFTKREYRDKRHKLAKKYGAIYHVLWVQTPLSVAINRAHSRSYHKLDRKTVLKINEEIEPPKGEPVIVVDGTQLYKTQRVQLKDHLFI